MERQAVWVSKKVQKTRVRRVHAQNVVLHFASRRATMKLIAAERTLALVFVAVLLRAAPAATESTVVVELSGAVSPCAACAAARLFALSEVRNASRRAASSERCCFGGGAGGATDVVGCPPIAFAGTGAEREGRGCALADVATASGCASCGIVGPVDVAEIIVETDASATVGAPSARGVGTLATGGASWWKLDSSITCVLERSSSYTI